MFFCKFKDLNSISVHRHAKKDLGQCPAILTLHFVTNPYTCTNVSYLLFSLEVYVPVLNFAAVGRRIVGIQFIVLPFGSLLLEDPFYSTTYKACRLILGYLKHVWLFLVGLVIPWRSQPNWRTRLFLLFGTSLCRRIRQGLTCQKPEASTGISLGNEMPHNVLPLVLCPVLASSDIFNFDFP